MMKRFWLLGFCWLFTLAGCSVLHIGHGANRPNPYDFAHYEQSPLYDKDWWAVMKDFWPWSVNTFREANAHAQPGGIVMVGDSITAGFHPDEFFPGKNIQVRGVSGDRIAGVINRLDLSIYDLKPRKVFLLIGTNDTNNPKMTARDYREQYDYLFAQLKTHCKGCKIYVQEIMPRHGAYGKTNPQVREANEILRQCAPRYGFTLIDTYTPLLDSEGQLHKDLSGDGVHLNKKGQQIWAEILTPYVND